MSEQHPTWDGIERLNCDCCPDDDGTYRERWVLPEDAVLAARRQVEAQREQERCGWQEVGAWGAFGQRIQTACKWDFNTKDAGSFKFCPFCGKRLEITRLKGATA